MQKGIERLPSPALPGAGSTGLPHTTTELSAICQCDISHEQVGSPDKSTMSRGVLCVKNTYGKTERDCPAVKTSVCCAQMFRPCIDLHEGRVKQIVGGSLDTAALRTNFVSDKRSAWFAALYRHDGLKGGHVIMLGPGNEEAALEALRAYPGGLQVGGGMHSENASRYLEAGASHVIVTSWIFREGLVEWDRLKEMVGKIGRQRLVLDLSCRKRGDDYMVVTDRWQKFTEVKVDGETLHQMAEYCDEFLVHAVDVEGLCRGIDNELVEKLAEWTPIPTTYAGGAKSLEDLETVTRIGRGRIDLTIGSALDIFGGTGVRYEDCVAFNKARAGTEG